MSGAEPGGRRRWIVGLAVVGVAVVGVLAFGVFGVHTLFIDDAVSEDGPVFESGAAAEVDDPVADTSASSTSVAVRPSTTTPAPTVREAGRGTFAGVDHPGQGTTVVLTDGTQSFVRFEDDFATDNGPDLYVTVTVGGQPIELGRLKGNVGAQNYELPADVDPDAVEIVSVWCKRFDSTFATASLP